MRSGFAAVFAAFVSFVAADNWAVLVAGSNGYYNYRHQADVCHSYQVLKSNGFSDDRIITMFYDDIARNSQNPVKDNLINQPDGPNVYTGCKKDYTGNLVTPENFLKVLSGEKMSVGSKKTLETGPDDNIFVFFSDHGATGLIAFPSSELHALDLNRTLTNMYANKKYKQMLIYIEACESGSMFNNILSDSINVLGVTASDPDHSSYAIYYDSTRGTYLGDVFSVYWMQDSEKESMTETIQQQFDVVKKETDTSVVCMYGQKQMSPEPLRLFQAPAPKVQRAETVPLVAGEKISSRDVHVATLHHRLMAASPADRPRIEDLLRATLARRDRADARVKRIVSEAERFARRPVVLEAEEEEDPCYPKSQTVGDAVCLKEMVNTMKAACGPFDDYTLSHVRVLNALCNAGVSPQVMGPAMKEICSD